MSDTAYPEMKHQALFFKKFCLLSWEGQWTKQPYIALVLLSGKNISVLSIGNKASNLSYKVNNCIPIFFLKFRWEL